MNDLLPAAVRARVGGSKWLPLHARADVGVGARRSKAIGPGIEFAQYRDYEMGDDLRYLDKHVYARLGRTVIRQFTVEQQMRASILLDASASMTVDPRKWRMAQELAALCGFVTLNGSDRVTYASFGGSGLRWGTSFSQPAKLEQQLDRIAELEPQGRTERLDEIARRSLEHLQGRGMLIVISDLFMDGIEEALKIWRARGQEILAVQVLGPHDVEPGEEILGWSRLVDVETHERSERYVDARALAEYREAFRSWQQDLRDAVWAAEGRWVSVRSDHDELAKLLTSFRRTGLIT